MAPTAEDVMPQWFEVPWATIVPSRARVWVPGSPAARRSGAIKDASKRLAAELTNSTCGPRRPFWQLRASRRSFGWPRCCSRMRPRLV